jgi:hypothetical protein
MNYYWLESVDTEFVDEIQTKVFRVFLLAIHSRLLQLCLEISSNLRNLLGFLQFSYCTVVHCTGKKGKPDRKPYSLPYGLRNPYRNLKS